ncbi:uncharacterized protein LOC133840285 [Drosophila sulfurigaster albostrigata]|uniref:uncharacterized protein LOC133840285 n=1 Tax=Drosophila sulfurigaster albostrigata TaxID=89887 RepID=UPI002D21EBA1|nr:uncharacterized protein LOC133840285 [Drosophila sulfurigaster albostrigata]
MSRTIVCLLSVVICLFAYANRCAYAACYRLQLAVNRYAAGATPKRERDRDRSNARNCVNVIKLSHDAVLFKFKNVQCKSYNESLMLIPLCQLRAISRETNVMNYRADWLYSVNDVYTEVQIFKRANGFKPWLFKYKLNFCEYLQKKNHRLFSLVFNLFKEYTNLATQTCPLVGNITVLGFSLKVDRLKLPLPTGVYLVTTGWILNKRLTSNLNITFEFVEDSGLDSEKSLFGH